jgi:hypothetical protein
MTYVNPQEPGDEVRTAQILANEILQHLRWKEETSGGLMLQQYWTPAKQEKFEAFEKSSCERISMWAWNALDKSFEQSIDGQRNVNVDKILTEVFLSLPSETIQAHVKTLIGQPHRTPQRKRSC